jgi:riboflavin synthase
MFTGLVSAIGEVTSAARRDGGRDLAIAVPWGGLEKGESIAVNGACLTVERVVPGGFQVHVVRTSLDRTALGRLRPGDRVNLERALRAGDALGGHLVQGHVDGVGTVVGISRRDDAKLFDIRVPQAVAQVTVPLGSITVDGVSLTVNAMPEPDVIQVSLIPFTFDHTTLGDRKVGDEVHLEADLLGKYVQAMLRRAPGQAGT